MHSNEYHWKLEALEIRIIENSKKHSLTVLVEIPLSTKST